jgi:hypothetical protein
MINWPTDRLMDYPHLNRLVGLQDEPLELPLDAKLESTRSVLSDPHSEQAISMSACVNTKTSNLSPQSLHLYS